MTCEGANNSEPLLNTVMCTGFSMDPVHVWDTFHFCYFTLTVALQLLKLLRREMRRTPCLNVVD